MDVIMATVSGGMEKSLLLDARRQVAGISKNSLGWADDLKPPKISGRCWRPVAVELVIGIDLPSGVKTAGL